MEGCIKEFLSQDHKRLEGLLNQATSDPRRVDVASYAQFRAGLLKHIAMEEKILLPAAQQANRGEPLSVAARLRLDHGALAALLVPTPTPAIIETISSILRSHNPLEEGPQGAYETCEQLAAGEAVELLRQLREAPAVKVAPHSDAPHVIEALRRALARAGYQLAEKSKSPSNEGESHDRN